MRKDINGRSYFTPSDVCPPLYKRVHMTKKAGSLDAVIFLVFIAGLILAFWSM